MAFFTELEKKDFFCNLYRNIRTRIAKAILKKKNGIGRIRLLDFKLHHKVVIIKIVWHWHRNRHIYLWNRIESPEIYSQLYGKNVYDKGGKNIVGKIIASLIAGVGKTGQLHSKESILA